MKHFAIIFTTAVLISLLAFSLHFSKHKCVVQALQILSSEEKYFLEAFFRHLISSDQGCNVLFGDKPTAFMVYEDWKKFDFKIWLRKFSDFSPQKKGLDVWLKYQHVFPLKRYVLICTRSIFPDEMGAVFLVHKKRLLGILKKNFIAFKTVFPKYATPKLLFNALIYNPKILQEICFKYDDLLGIILGFGKDNAILFKRQTEIERFLFPRNFTSTRPIFDQPFLTLTPKSSFSSLEEELKFLTAKSSGIITAEESQQLHRVITMHFLLGFLVDKTKTDVQKLRTQFLEERKRATLAYGKGNFLEITLQELMR